jgi:hypothetical protein
MKSCASCSASRRRKSSGCGSTRSSERTHCEDSHEHPEETETRLPLAGIRVIDAATVIAAPYSATIL